jgi:hypothetical protein
MRNASFTFAAVLLAVVGVLGLALKQDPGT